MNEFFHRPNKKNSIKKREEEKRKFFHRRQKVVSKKGRDKMNLKSLMIEFSGALDIFFLAKKRRHKKNYLHYESHVRFVIIVHRFFFFFDEEDFEKLEEKTKKGRQSLFRLLQIVGEIWIGN